MTDLTRRTTLAGLASLATAPAFAQTYPQRPISLIVPWAAGGSTDILARIIGQHLHQAMGQPVIIENRTGAAGNIGTGAVARAAADGYTLLFNTMSVHTMNHALFAAMPFDGVKDFSPITLLAYVTNTMVVHPSVPANTVAETVPGYEMTVWYGAFGPPGMPRGIVAQLNSEIVRALFRPEVKQRMDDIAVEVASSTPEELGLRMRADAGKWGGIIRSIGI